MIARLLSLGVAVCVLVLTTRRASADPLIWNYVGRPARSMTVKLPPPFKTCDDKDELKITGTLKVPVYSSTASDLAARTADKTAQCSPSMPATPKTATLTVVAPSLRKADVKEFAFDWSRDNASEFAVHLELSARVDDEVLRATRLNIDDVPGSAQFTGRDAETGLPRFAVSGVSANRPPTPGQVHLAPLTDVSELHDPKTGELWDEALEAEPRWLLKPETEPASFAKPQAGLPSETVRAELPDHSLNRFLAPGPIECVTGKKDCTLTRSGGHWYIDAEGATLDNLARSLELPVSVTLLQPIARSLKPAKLSVKVVVVECIYDVKQLTRVEAGRSQVTSLFQIKRTGNDASRCKATDWVASLKKAGGADVVASGRVAVKDDLATVTWATLPTVTPNVAQTYVLEFKYGSGQLVALKVPPPVVVDTAINPTDNLRVYTSLTGDVGSVPTSALLDISGRKSLAMNRENRIDVGALTPPTSWKLTLIGASSYFPTCPRGSDTTSFCVKPLHQTDEILKLRAEQRAAPAAVALPGAESMLPTVAPTEISLGYVDVVTGFNVRPHRVALNLEKHLKVVCGARVIEGDLEGVPASVPYSCFNSCELVFDPRDVGADAHTVLRNSDEQLIEVSAARVPTDGTAPKLEVLDRFRLHVNQPLASCHDGKGKVCLSFPLSMRRAVAGEAKDYTMVHIEAKHVAEQYDTTIQDSQHQKTFVARVRRQPEWLATPWTEDGSWGPRLFFTFTVAPFTLFRAPHSGRNVWKSSDVAKLEAATFGAGFVAVTELWNFDSNSPPWPFLTPQLQVGVLSTVPTSQQLDYPALSLVGGIALRTGVDTAPDAKVETAAKFLIWGEWLNTFGERRVDPSWNLLFGFAVDVGSFGN